jgi:hypothetical protein
VIVPALRKIQKRNDEVPFGVIPRFWGISGIFVPCGVVRQPAAPTLRANPVISHARSRFPAAGENQYWGIATDILAVGTGGTYSVEDSIVAYVYDAPDLADYSFVLSSSMAVASPATPAMPLRNSEEERENVVEFRTLPSRIESLASLHGKVRISNVSSALASESRRHSPNIEDNFEEVPE